MVIIIHCLLAILLFFIINWIGKHSYPYWGYTRLSLYPQNDKSLAFNFILKAIGPVIYLIIIASIFYHLQLDRFVINIYLVSIYYVVLRIFVILITNKTKFVSWSRYVFYQVSIVLFSYFSYKNLIIEKKNIIPDLSSISNELWIIILVFLYQVLNKIELSNASSVKKKEHYIKNQYLGLKRKYGDEVSSALKNQKLEALFFSIMIFEDFNRPKMVRLCEYLRFFLFLKKIPHTLGIMQYRSAHYIDDAKSVSLALKKIKADYLRLKEHGENKNYEWGFLNSLIQEYNGSTLYYSEVGSLYDTLINFYYKDTQDNETVANLTF